MHKRHHAHRSSVTDGIADYDCFRAAADCGAVHAPYGFRITARGVLGDVHYLETERDRIFHRVLSGAQKEVVGPVFGVASDWAGADKCCRLDRNASALDDFGNRADVVLMGAGSTVGLDLQLGAANLASQRLAM